MCFSIFLVLLDLDKLFDLPVATQAVVSYSDQNQDDQRVYNTQGDLLVYWFDPQPRMLRVGWVVQASDPFFGCLDYHDRSVPSLIRFVKTYLGH